MKYILLNIIKYYNINIILFTYTHKHALIQNISLKMIILSKHNNISSKLKKTIFSAALYTVWRINTMTVITFIVYTGILWHHNTNIIIHFTWLLCEQIYICETLYIFIICFSSKQSKGSMWSDNRLWATIEIWDLYFLWENKPIDYTSFIYTAYKPSNTHL